MRHQRHTTDRIAAPTAAPARTYAPVGRVPSFVPVTVVPVPVMAVPVVPAGTGVAPQE